MTICLAVTCENSSNVVLAADTMVTNDALSIEFEHPGKKITRLSETCVALTAGDALAYTEMFNAVQQEICRLRDSTVAEIVETIKTCFQRIRRKEIVERILQPRGFPSFEAFYENQRHLIGEVAYGIQGAIDGYDYGLQIIVAGTTAYEAHVYGVGDPGTSKCFDAINFHAIGSGLPHAVNMLIGRGINSQMSLQEAILVVYEAKLAAEKAPGVGNVTDMAIIGPGAFVDIPRKEIENLKPILQLWNRQDDWKPAMSAFLRSIGLSDEQDQINNGDAIQTNGAQREEAIRKQGNGVPQTGGEGQGPAKKVAPKRPRAAVK